MELGLLRTVRVKIRIAGNQQILTSYEYNVITILAQSPIKFIHLQGGFGILLLRE